MSSEDRLRFAVVCASNMNRSMEGHAFLEKKGYDVKSYGTGDKVKLPGARPDQPNVYEFGTSYDFIYQDLYKKDKLLYTQNGLLHMLDRNRRIKPNPEPFLTTKEQFDVVITCEERVYDKALESLEGRIPEENIPVHVINIDIEDNHEEATLGAFMICDLAAKLSAAEDLDDNIDEILHEFEVRTKRNILHSVQFY